MSGVAQPRVVERPLENAWMLRAACRVPGATEVMYSLTPEGISEAKKICFGCPVRAECLEYAIDHRERDGVWGGASERERLRIIRRRRSAT